MATKTFNLEGSSSNGQGDVALPAVAAPARQAGAAVTREAHNFVADVEDLITANTSLTGADLARAKARLAERVEAARQAVARTGTAVDSYVHQNPWKAVGFGAAAATAFGLLLGMLLARR